MADPRTLNLRAARDAAERDCLLRALAEAHGMVVQACELLGISRPLAYALIKKHGLTLQRMAVVRVPASDEPPAASPGEEGRA